MDGLFSELDVMHYRNPKGYMDKALCSGSFDRPPSSDSSFVSPEKWRSHFTDLLSQDIQPFQADQHLIDYILENQHSIDGKFDVPILKE